MNTATESVLRAIEEWCDEINKSLKGDFDLAEKLIELRDIRKFLDVLKKAEGLLVTATGPKIRKRGEVIEGLGLVEGRRGKSRKNWEHDAIIGRIVARVSDELADRETGEMLPPAAIAQRTADAIKEGAGISYWRTTAEVWELIGRKPDEFCTTEDGNWAVTISEGVIAPDAKKEEAA